MERGPGSNWQLGSSVQENNVDQKKIVGRIDPCARGHMEEDKDCACVPVCLYVCSGRGNHGEPSHLWTLVTPKETKEEQAVR
jgi:hypothetical protein